MCVVYDNVMCLVCTILVFDVVGVLLCGLCVVLFVWLV